MEKEKRNGILNLLDDINDEIGYIVSWNKNFSIQNEQLLSEAEESKKEKAGTYYIDNTDIISKLEIILLRLRDEKYRLQKNVLKLDLIIGGDNIKKTKNEG